MAKTIVRSLDGLRTEIKARNHVFYADEPVDAGGADSGPMPTEMLLGALGACIVITTQLYAQRKGWPLEGVEVSLDEERFLAKDYPAYEGDATILYELRKQIVFRGPLDEAQRERLLEIAGKCPVHRIIANPTFFIEQVLEAEALPTE